MELYGNGVGEGALRIHKPLHTDFPQLCSSKHWGDCAKLLLPSLFLPYPLLSELLLVLGGGLVTKSGLSLATAWTIAHQAPLYMEFSRQKYWSGLPFFFSRTSSRPRDQTWVSCIAGGFFTNWVTSETLLVLFSSKCRGVSLCLISLNFTIWCS